MAGEKRSAAEAEELAHKESVILLDVEGTTSSIGFIKDTLFPYVREFLKTHVDEKWSDEEFKADFAKLKEQAKDDEEKKVDGFVPIKEDTEEEAKKSLVQYVLWQMDNDRKTGALKQLQGHIWKAAHKPIKGHIYDDVPKAFEAWTGIGKKLYIYSSGSVEAQKLLFGNSVHGDLLKYISGHFDTEVGAKQEAQSYKNILKKIGFESSDVLFLTDVIKEAEAAKAAGLSTTIVIRNGNVELSDDEKSSYKTIESFAELSFQTSTKRQKIEERDNVTEKKIEIAKEKKSTTAIESTCEPMDTSEDVEMTIDSTKKDSLIKPKIEKLTEEKEIPKGSEKSVDNVEIVTHIQEETIPDEKIVTGVKMEIEKYEGILKKETKKNAEKIDENIEKKEIDVLNEKSKLEVSAVEKKPAEKKSENTGQKSEETKKVTEKVAEEINVENKVEGTISIVNVLEKEKMSETVLTKLVENEKVTKKVTEKKVAEKEMDKTTNATEDTMNIKKGEEELKLEEKEINKVEKKFTEEIKENGETKILESVENKVDESENKENVQSIEEVAKVEKKNEIDSEKIEEPNEIKEIETTEKEKQIETEKETADKVKLEDDTPKETESKKLNGTTTNGDSIKNITDEKVHSNGVSNESEKTKENGDAEESIKMKKAIADGAGEPDVVSPPVVTAAS